MSGRISQRPTTALPQSGIEDSSSSPPPVLPGPTNDNGSRTTELIGRATRSGLENRARSTLLEQHRASQPTESLPLPLRRRAQGHWRYLERGNDMPVPRENLAHRLATAVLPNPSSRKLTKPRRNPFSDENQKAIAAKLGELAQHLSNWESSHPMNLGRAAQALTLAAQAREEKLGLGERSTKYTQAETLMRQARGIDDDTWKRAKKAIGMQGLADVYDNAATVLIAGPLLAAAAGPGAEPLGATLGKVIKYASLWTVTAASNGAGQIVVDGYQDMTVRHEGLPNFLPEVTSAPKLREIYRQVAESLKRCKAPLERALSEVALSEARKQQPDVEVITACMKQLQIEEKKLDELQSSYRKRIALGLSNFIKYETQVAYKLATAAPVAMSGIMAGPFALYGAVTAQQALQAPFGYVDEILLKKHIARSNTKYGEFRTDDAIAAGITPLDPEWGADCISADKLKRTWTSPLDVLQTNVSFIYTDELAKTLRQIAKQEKHMDKLDARLQEQERSGQPKSRNLKKKCISARKKYDEIAGKLETLARDIGHFEAGVAAVRKGEQNLSEWGNLSPNGKIARVLVDPAEHFTALTAAKFKRPGEYTAQVLDRHGGLALPRSIFAGIADLFKLNDQRLGASAQEVADRSAVAQTDIAGGAFDQQGRLGSSGLLNPITKFTKQRVTRRKGLPAPPKQSPDGTIERKSLLAAHRRPVTGGDRLQPIIEVPLPASQQLVAQNALQPTPRVDESWLLDASTSSLSEDENPLSPTSPATAQRRLPRQVEKVEVDIRNTRAFWRATHSASSSVAIGIRDAVVGFGSHMKAAATLPLRATEGSIASHKAKNTAEKIRELGKRFPSEGRNDIKATGPRKENSSSTSRLPGEKSWLDLDPTPSGSDASRSSTPSSPEGRNDAGATGQRNENSSSTLLPPGGTSWLNLDATPSSPERLNDTEAAGQRETQQNVLPVLDELKFGKSSFVEEIMDLLDEKISSTPSSPEGRNDTEATGLRNQNSSSTSRLPGETSWLDLDPTPSGSDASRYSTISSPERRNDTEAAGPPNADSSSILASSDVLPPDEPFQPDASRPSTPSSPEGRNDPEMVGPLNPLVPLPELLARRNGTQPNATDRMPMPRPSAPEGRNHTEAAGTHDANSSSTLPSAAQQAPVSRFSSWSSSPGSSPEPVQAQEASPAEDSRKKKFFQKTRRALSKPVDKVNSFASRMKEKLKK